MEKERHHHIPLYSCSLSFSCILFDPRAQTAQFWPNVVSLSSTLACYNQLRWLGVLLTFFLSASAFIPRESEVTSSASCSDKVKWNKLIGQESLTAFSNDFLLVERYPLLAPLHFLTSGRGYRYGVCAKHNIMLTLTSKTFLVTCFTWLSQTLWRRQLSIPAAWEIWNSEQILINASAILNTQGTGCIQIQPCRGHFQRITRKCGDNSTSLVCP